MVGDRPRFSGINAYAESYFGSSLYNSQLFNSTSMTSTKMTHISPRSIAEIHFATPFVYLPLKGASESLGIMPDVFFSTFDGTLAVYTQVNTTISISTRHPYNRDNSEPDYGYVPQALIDWMARDADYVSRYPYIASCYPGGPSIKPDNIQVVNGQCEFFEVSPEAATVVPDLTIATHVTVSSAGCFHPGACPTPAPAATPKVATAAHTGLPVASEEASVVSPTPEKSQYQQTAVTNPPTPAPGLGGIIASALGGNPFAPPPSAPSSNALASEVPSLNTPLPSPNVPTPNLPTSNVPISNAPPQIPSTTNLEGGQNPLSSYAISLALSASVVVINGVTSSVPPAGSDTGNVAGGPIITVGSQSITLNSASQLVVAGQTLTPGAPAISIKGTAVSLDSSANSVVVAGSTIALPSAVSAPAITIASQPITLNSASQYVVAGETLTPGGPAIDIQGTPVSLAPSASAVVVAGSTILLSPTSASLPTLIIGSQTFTANSASAYIIGGQTLVPGQPAINVPGSAIGLLTTPSPSSPPLYTVGGQTFTPNPTAFAIAGTTVSAGGPGVTVSGTLVSLGPSGTLVIGTSTIVLANGASSPIFTVGGQTFTANPTAFAIASTTLSAGGPGVTIAGTPVSLAPAGNLIVGNRTTTLAQTSSKVLSFTGAAGRKGAGVGGLVGACAVMLVL